MEISLKNKIITRLSTGKKSFRTTLFILVLAAVPPYIVGWQRDIAAFLVGTEHLYELSSLFAFGYILVPPFFFASAILSFILILIESQIFKRLLYSIISITTLILSVYTFREIIN